MTRIFKDERILLLLLVLTQAFFWFGVKIPGAEGGIILWRGSREIKPELAVVPELHSDAMVKTLSFGDDQFYFRVMGYQIQNAGDSFGRSTPLKNYDYSKLYKWWLIFDDIDAKSDFIPSLASYYYGATQDKPKQLPYVIDYLEQHSDRDPPKKWWWYTQAIYHSKTGLGDTDRALEIANKLRYIPSDIKMPIWAREMAAFIHEDRGEYKEACQIIVDILVTYKDLDEGEKNFINYFINDRLRAMEEHYDDADLDPRCKEIIDENRKLRQKAEG